MLERARVALKAETPPPLAQESRSAACLRIFGKDPTRCTHCLDGRLILIARWGATKVPIEVVLANLLPEHRDQSHRDLHWSDCAAADLALEVSLHPLSPLRNAPSPRQRLSSRRCTVYARLGPQEPHSLPRRSEHPAFQRT